MDKLREKIVEALKKDFRNLYVKDFTYTWETERLIRELEIDVMSLENLQALFPDVEEIRRQAFEDGYTKGQQHSIGTDKRLVAQAVKAERERVRKGLEQHLRKPSPKSHEITNIIIYTDWWRNFWEPLKEGE